MNTQSNVLTRLFKTTILAALAGSALLAAAPAQAGAQKGYPACIYLYEKAGEQKLSNERSCLRWGGFGIKAAGGDEKKFSDKRLKKDIPHFAQPVQYVDIRAGWTAVVWHEAPNGQIVKTKMTQSGPIDIRRGKLRGIWTFDRADYVKGYPVCIYTSKHDMKRKNDNLCLRYGEYADLKQFGWDTVGKRADFVDIRPGYKLELYAKPNWGGGKWEVSKDGRLPKDIRNKVRSLRIVKTR